MRRLLLWLIFGLAAHLPAQQPVLEEGRIRFCAVDIYVDAQGAPLAAYQLEFRATNGTARIVGIEGGEHLAFREPPHYDPKAMQSERVVLGAFSLAAPDALPKARTRVATIHLQITGTKAPEFQLKLQAAADGAGNRIAASASLEQKGTK